jgi:hypothetical protein
VIHSGTCKDLCELVSEKAGQTSQYSRGLSAVNPWENLPQTLKEFVASTTASKKRSRALIE